MDNEETVDVEETLEAPEEETAEEFVEEDEQDDLEDLKSRLAKAEEIATNQTKRAEKAEKKAKAKPEPVNDSGLSPKDIIALAKADLGDEDFDEVMDFASRKDISVSEALKSPIIKATLEHTAELRKSADAVSTGSTRRGSSQVSDERLLENASNGLLPKSDADMNRLAQLKVGGKR